MIYKILRQDEWAAAKAAGRFAGSIVDVTDGYIHFSASDQVRATAAKHFAGQVDLLLLAVDETQLNPALKWEVSRDGALFPHLYSELPVVAVTEVWRLPWNGTRHDFPEGL